MSDGSCHVSAELSVCACAKPTPGSIMIQICSRSKTSSTSHLANEFRNKYARYLLLGHFPIVEHINV
jgi:hypothetical protein